MKTRALRVSSRSTLIAGAGLVDGMNGAGTAHISEGGPLFLEFGGGSGTGNETMFHSEEP